MRNSEELAAHALMKAVFDGIRPLLDEMGPKLRAAAELGKIRGPYPAPIQMTETQTYDYSVFKKASAILECLYHLHDIPKFIRRFPSPRTYEKEGISQYRWIEYHYSFYVITIMSVYDTALLLVNAAFRLGNPDRICRRNLIVENEWVKHSGVDGKLAALDDVVDPHRSERNLYVHRRMGPELAEAFSSELLDYLKLISFANGFGELIIDRPTLGIAFEIEIKNVIKKLNEEILRLEDAVRQLFDSLLPVYRAHTDVLK